MKHRIFIAINLPKDIKNKLEECQNKTENLFASYQNEDSGTGPIRWTKKENLHITLLFLGYLSNEEFLEVLGIIKKAAQGIKPFSINLNKICYGPPNQNKPPRMIWARGEKNEEMGKLKKGLENSLLSCRDDANETRPYLPHITLGRIKMWEWRRIEPEERPIVDTDVSLNFEVNSIELMESQLKKGGPQYYVLESFPLLR